MTVGKKEEFSYRRASFTVEGAILFPMLLLIFVIAISMGLHFYTEITEDKTEPVGIGMWEVSDFYKYEGIGELLND